MSDASETVTDTYAPPDTPLEVIHEDHELLLVDKPSGLLSVPGKGEHLADCLLTRVQEVFPTALLVHRLDRDTSGIMVFALTPHAQRHLGLQFEHRRTKKTYVARVAGKLEPRTGTVDDSRDDDGQPETGEKPQQRFEHSQLHGYCSS